jgi:hypothetical protein
MACNAGGIVTTSPAVPMRIRVGSLSHLLSE